MNEKIIYTIGHSNNTIENFVNLLKKYKINCLIDVRSVPYSQRTPQFNKEDLKFELKKYSILYESFAEEFGARREEKDLLFQNGCVNFELVKNTDLFKKGVKRIENGITKGYNIVIMCTEKDPYECHRFVLVSNGLKEAGFTVKHILYNGTLVENEELEKQMLVKYMPNYSQINLEGKFYTKKEALIEAYKKRNLEIGYYSMKEGEENL